MFGYININKEQLSEEDLRTYLSYYCGLCHKLNDLYGRKAQIFLNYDITFLVVLLTGLYEPEDEYEKEFLCALHPARRRMLRSNEFTDYAAHMNILLTYHNLVDDWRDRGSLSKKTAASLLRKSYEDVCAKYPRQSRAVEEYMTKLNDYEKLDEANIDVVAGFTGEMLGEIFAYKEDLWYDELKTLGFYMGKFIYLMDAYEDLESDRKHNQYNALRKLHDERSDDYETLCKLMMTSMMSECAKSFERLPILLHAGILRNILYSGVWGKYEYIQQKKRKKK
ncbi:MAG: DUF5685 family protein [Clostridiales bacterium]|nr:DUF5685 family protein [Clostridiales bacterium]